MPARARTAAEPVRVALLSPCFWPEARRGTERFVRDLADGLLARGHSPRLITSHRGPPRRAVEDGLPVLRLPRPPARRLRRRRYEDHLTHVPLSYLALRAGEDDLAQAVYPSDALAAGRWSARTGRPSILSYHGIATHRWLADRRRRAEITLAAARACTAVTANSLRSAEALRRSLGVEARVIYPGVDLARFAPPPRSPEPAAPVLLCAAAADQPAKRVRLLIGALPHVRRARPGTRLVLVRPDDPVAAARLDAATEGVELIAPLEDPRALAAVYGRATVSALPSRGEPFGLVLVESLACGTPVVGANDGAIPEIVDSDEVGRLFEGEDERAVARALLEAIELAEDPGTAARCRRSAERFSAERCAAEHESLYRELLAR